MRVNRDNSLKVSVITIVYNAVDTLEETILSVVGQTYDNVEYVIVDGASEDGSLEVIEKYRGNIDHLVSEPDDGIYFAMNKGVNMATGDVIAILNADDTYASAEVLEKVVRLLSSIQSDSVYGDLNYVDRKNPARTIRQWKSGNFSRSSFLNGWMPPHPSFFAKREVYEKYGSFNTDLRTSADYEFMLRVLYKEKISTAYLPEVLVNMKTGGQSNLSWRNRLKANREDRLAWKINGLKPSRLTFINKPFRKIGQFLIPRT